MSPRVRFSHSEDFLHAVRHKGFPPAWVTLDPTQDNAAVAPTYVSFNLNAQFLLNFVIPPAVELSRCDTKRQLVSLAARVFDSLGCLAPFTVRAKQLFQALWLRGLLTRPSRSLVLLEPASKVFEFQLALPMLLLKTEEIPLHCL
ncbi:hypothetical protein T4E_10651 [Trichinella pseudospiralis]|uniref:Uncharacterized protein n=1 Tax=Trichinella pseudospiralis TaxID=6337 RepID=A0A0V0YPI6_TRIPS|nr:hypothetical protein T4E_10651 [Trichinella pseudospiralis]